MTILPACRGGLLGGLLSAARGSDAALDPKVAAAVAAGDYGVDVSTQIHGHLNRNTFQVLLFINFDNMHILI